MPANLKKKLNKNRLKITNCDSQKNVLPDIAEVLLKPDKLMCVCMVFRIDKHSIFDRIQMANG